MSIIVISASAAGCNSTTLALARRAVATLWPGQEAREILLAQDIPPALGPAFLEAAFTPNALRDDLMKEALAYSDRQVQALRSATRLVIATPMYNFGIPGLLKSWFDQIIRPGCTFEMTEAEDAPYRGLLTFDACMVVTTRGSFDATMSGSDCTMLQQHMRMMLSLIGAPNPRFLDVQGTDADRVGAPSRFEIAIEELMIPSQNAA